MIFFKNKSNNKQIHKTHEERIKTLLELIETQITEWDIYRLLKLSSDNIEYG